MPKKKRGNREGSIRKRANGLWEARYYDATGARRSAYAKTHKEAAAKLNRALNERDTGVAYSFDAERLTFGEFLGMWLEDSVAARAKERTYERYESTCRVHLIPALGTIRLRDLTPAHLQSLYASRMRAGAKPATVRMLHIVASGALTQATHWQLIGANPAARTSPPAPGPAQSQEEIRYLSREEVASVMEVARGRRLGALFIAAVFSGLRSGELLGLKWSDVDLEKGELRVNRQLTRTKKSGLHFASPKNETSRRSVDVPELVVDALKSRRTEQLEERLAAGSIYARGTELVFTNTLGKPLEPFDQSKRYLKPLLERSGIERRYRFHDLRHTYATLNLMNAVHPRVVQKAMGHATISETMNRYSHVIPSMGQDAAKALGALF